ncbi:uncharacterized protein [Arachis hypogaea]|uniref:uncharacterized protein n=1 Tax=Arachis hypogaea TaxID=3818 RepID=UPI003B2274F7
MVTELRQAVAEENQRMANQIANLNNTRTENNNDWQERTEEAEQQSGPTHVSDTARQEEEQPEHNKEAQKDIENDDQESSTGPFTAEVMNFVLPRRFTLTTTLTPYDGLGDPKKYIKKFTSIMIVNGASDKVLCHFFPSYLDGSALDWFCSLPAGSISRFRDISKPFEKNFAGSAIYLHDSDYLNTVKQGQHESLKDYMTRFTKIAISIPSLHPEVELHAIKSGLRPEKFQETIAVAKPKTTAEFREKAKGQIDIEELRQAWKPPRKAGSYPDSKGTDRSKYCSFHQKHGHNTDDCVIAKDLLKRLARQGHLDKYISGHMQRQAPPSGDLSSVTQHGRDRDRPNNSHPEVPTRTINCISRSFAGGGATNLARKRSYRAILSINANQIQQQPLPTSPHITFQTANHDNNVANLDDPVVISLQLGDLLVKKVLLDPGSSADVLFYSTFQKMKLSNNVIQPSTGDLVGFSGERVPVMGSVWLQTTLSKFPSSKTSDIQYLVVDCFSPYNLILGRPFLNRFGAIVSTIHLCVKFPLQDNTIATIHSDVREARECYNNSLKRPNRNTKAHVHNIGNMNDQHMLADLDPRVGTLERATLTEDLDKIYFTENTDKFTYVGSTLSSEEKSSFQAFLYFMYAYFGYNQIQMHPSDQNKTAFITEYGNYCYNVMPFGLKNAGATYQRLMDKIFAKQSGRNIEVYVDDMVTKTKIANNHLDDLTEIFGQLRKYNMRLNPENCAFGVQSVLSTTEDYIEWSLYVDGSSNPQGCGAVIILDDGHDNVIEHSLNFSFKASNNQSEYEALIAGLRLAANLNITELKVYCDSLLIVQQHIPRESNGRADILSKLASTQPNGSSLYQSTLLKPSIELTQVLSVTQEADWRSSNIQYLQTGILPGDVENARHFRRQASFFTIYNNCLYRRGFSRLLLKCLCRIEAELALTEAHEGIYGTHLGARSLYSKILRAGLYWPTIRQDCQAKVKSCTLSPVSCSKLYAIGHLLGVKLELSQGLKVGTEDNNSASTPRD